MLYIIQIRQPKRIASNIGKEALTIIVVQILLTDSQALF